MSTSPIQCCLPLCQRNTNTLTWPIARWTIWPTIWLLRINKTWPTKTGNLKISHTSSSYSLNGERENKRRNFENYRNTEGYVVSEVTKYMLERFFCQLLDSKRKEETGLFSTENLISDPSKKRSLSTQKIKTKCPKQFKFERIY